MNELPSNELQPHVFADKALIAAIADGATHITPLAPYACVLYRPSENSDGFSSTQLFKSEDGFWYFGHDRWAFAVNELPKDAQTLSLYTNPQHHGLIPYIFGWTRAAYFAGTQLARLPNSAYCPIVDWNENTLAKEFSRFEDAEARDEWLEGAFEFLEDLCTPSQESAHPTEYPKHGELSGLTIEWTEDSDTPGTVDELMLVVAVGINGREFNHPEMDPLTQACLQFVIEEFERYCDTVHKVKLCAHFQGTCKERAVMMFHKHPDHPSNNPNNQN